MIDPLLKLATGLAIAEPTPFGEALVLTGLVAYSAIRAARNFRELQSGEKSSLNRFNIVQFDGDVLPGPTEDSFAQDFGLIQEPAQTGDIQDAILSNPAELIQGLLKTLLPQEAVRDPSFSQDLPQLGPQDPVVRQEGGEVENFAEQLSKDFGVPVKIDSETVGSKIALPVIGKGDKEIFELLGIETGFEVTLGSKGRNIDTNKISALHEVAHKHLGHQVEFNKSGNAIWNKEQEIEAWKFAFDNTSKYGIDIKNIDIDKLIPKELNFKVEGGEVTTPKDFDASGNLIDSKGNISNFKVTKDSSGRTVLRKTKEQFDNENIFNNFKDADSLRIELRGIDKRKFPNKKVPGRRFRVGG